MKKKNEDNEQIFNLDDVIAGHKADLALAQVAEQKLDAMLKDGKKHSRSVMEDIYTSCMKQLYLLGRRFHPLSDYGKSCIDYAVKKRKEFEATVGPLLTMITKDNIIAFLKVLSPEMQEDILFNRCKAVGIFKGEKTNLYGVGATLFYADKSPVGPETILRVKWMYVHEDYRRLGIAEMMLGELVHIMDEQGFSAMTFDFPMGSDYADIYGELLTKWHFTFATGLAPDFTFIAKNKKLPEYLKGKTNGVVGMDKLSPPEVAKLIHTYFTRKQVKNFASYLKKPRDYYDLSLSCFVGEASHPVGLLLAHKSGSGRIVIEYLGTHSKKGGRYVVRLLRYAVNKVVSLYGVDAELFMPIDTYEKGEAMDILFPRQTAGRLVEGILAPPFSDENVTIDMINNI